MTVTSHADSDGGLCLGAVTIAGQTHAFCDAAAAFGPGFARLPHVLRLLLENALRNDPPAERPTVLAGFRSWLEARSSAVEIPFLPNRIMMHDTTCGPALVDIAAMRDVLAENGLDPSLLNPGLPVDVSTDHSSGVDVFGSRDALRLNLDKEFARNAERYRLMKWASAVMPSIRVHPPGSGIMHTINLERLSEVVIRKERNGAPFLHPDMMLGTDSHTPMVNGLGVLAWGVGGLEAEGAFFGVPTLLRIPEVVGVKLEGRLREGALATDLALVVTERLRALGVAGDFVEFFGPGVSTLSVGERGAVANMAPEYGATTGFFPLDEAACTYLTGLGRSAEAVNTVRAYAKAAGLWFNPSAELAFTRQIVIDLSLVRQSVAGPRRPQDRRDAGDTRGAFDPPLATPTGSALSDGAVAIAAITSCTNTSDLRMLVAAGLLARKANEHGLRVPSWVKTSLAPGSPAAGRLLARADLMQPLEALGFSIVGYGCTTCIGNSGALTDEVKAALGGTVRPVAVLSGNRNFPGRVHPDLEFGFLASPPLVIAFALAGTVDIDIAADPLGFDKDGRPVMLADLWPSGVEIDAALMAASDSSAFGTAYSEAARNPAWLALEAPSTPRFPWDDASTYLRRPPFVRVAPPSLPTKPARALLVLGDDITTDHISPANQIRPDSEAGRHIVMRGGDARDLNVFAARRGNFEVMLRGAFTNRLAVNQLTSDHPAGFTRHTPSGEVMSLVATSERYAAEGTPLFIVAGERYGMGSSRDWAAKAVALLGVRAVIASSIERIHRSNLIGMGVLPLLLPANMTVDTLGIRNDDAFEIDFALRTLAPRSTVRVRLIRVDGSSTEIEATAAVETSLEVELLRAGGMIPHVLRRLLDDARPMSKAVAS
jgi:aconitate hydratase